MMSPVHIAAMTKKHVIIFSLPIQLLSKYGSRFRAYLLFTEVPLHRLVRCIGIVCTPLEANEIIIGHYGILYLVG